jgi:hypothetical protein
LSHLWHFQEKFDSQGDFANFENNFEIKKLLNFFWNRRDLAKELQ